MVPKQNVLPILILSNSKCNQFNREKEKCIRENMKDQVDGGANVIGIQNCI